MAYSVSCWTNTGYNAVNIPDAPARLGEASFTLPALDIVQDWGLDSVRVRVGDQAIQNIDYVKIGNEYYSCIGVTKQSSDVALLSLVYDAITSAGGPTNISYLDGITERHTVSDDSMFKYTQEDELMAPRESLKLDDEIMFDYKEGSTYVESTIDLVALGKQFSGSADDLKFKGTGITFTDGDGENSVTVPYTEGVPGETYYLIDTSEIGGHEGQYNRQTKVEGACLYPVQYVQKGLAAARALGVESAIIAQFTAPSSSGASYETGTLSKNGEIHTATGKCSKKTSKLSFKYATVKNNRVLYGENNKYGLLTASGSRGEYNPEQIASASDEAPDVCALFDPRPDGKPYFRFQKYMGDSSVESIMIASVEGLSWKQVPLVFTKPADTVLNTMNFDNSAKQASNLFNYNQGMTLLKEAQSVTNGMFDIGKQSANAIGQAFDKDGNLGTALSSAVGAFQSAANIGYNTEMYSRSFNNNINQYNLQRQKELQNYGFSQTVSKPVVMFPYSADFIRDFFGNGVLVYRYKYSDNDVARIDKLLTMYGYKDTVALTADCFYQRTNFDYVKASGISIGGNLPMWKKDLITDQLNAGVRVWHVKPSPAYYTNNPIKGSK